MPITDRVRLRKLESYGKHLLAFKYVIRGIRNPVAGSNFANAVGPLLSLSDTVLIRTLVSLEYEGIVFYSNSHIVGHIFYQKHKVPGGVEWRVFSVSVVPRFRNQGYGTEIVKSFLQDGFANNVKSIQFGAGGDPWVTALYEKAVANELGLPFRLMPERTGEVGKILFRA